MKQLNKYILIILTLSSFIFNQKVESRISDTESSESEKIYKRAKKLERKGFFDESEKLLIEIFNDFPANDKYFNAIKKILIKKEDCLGLMNYTEQYSKAKQNNIYSQIQEIESSIICNADWENQFSDLLSNHINNSMFIKKLISMLLNNNEKDLAISSINKKRAKDNNNSFFAIELGYYYLSLKDYESSLIEYLNHLDKFPKQLEMINQRIISFSDDINTNKKLILILEAHNTREAKIILSDLYFKIDMVQDSINILKRYNLYNELFSMAINVDLIEEHNVAHDLFLYIINNSKDQKIIQKTMYAFANSLEKRSAINELELPISGFMIGNSYFDSPFIKTDAKDSIYLYKAKAIYDSLNIKGNNLQSQFQLAEIDFKIFQYLDESLNSYKSINYTTNDKDLKLKSINRAVDVLIAKGKLEEALEFINIEISKSMWNENEKINLQIKLNQILFYQSKLDLVFENLSLLLKECSSQEDIYNDMLSILSVILILKDEDKYISNNYLKAQLKINQNKRVESIGILNSILEDCNNQKIDCQNNLILDLIKYQISSLLVYQNKPDDAIIILESINGDGIYNELSKIFLAEIYDYIKNDENIAAQYYLFILQEYPKSIHYENIRKRLRTILEKA